MGMDVYGKNPTGPVGEYFRNNVWWWPPLWHYCQTVAPALTGKVKYGYSNDCDGLDAADAKALAVALAAELELGRTAAYAAIREAEIAQLPRQECVFCGGTGVRTDEVGVNLGQPSRVIDEPGHPRYGQTGWCNGCDGYGTNAHPDSHYGFSVENVREFAAFLADCGGFEIC